MKLLTLDLRAVGPFTGTVLDLSAGQHGLHLVYGPNEAGKTSALRALSYLLFSFPTRSADNFVHPNDQIRVGGRLRHSDGGALEFLRRRGNRNTLRGSDDSSIIPDERLARFLGGMSLDTFEVMFGIDHERLTRAGEEIRTGQGQLGELLFAAGAGLAGLRRAQQTLQQRLDDLFKPRAQNPRINKSLAELRDTQDELKQKQLPSEEWQKHDRAFREAVEESKRLSDEIRSARAEQGRLKRIKSAIPIMARRRRLTQDREALGSVLRLRGDFGDEFRQAQDQLRLAEHAENTANATILEVNALLDRLDPPRALLDAAPQIEALQERLGAVSKAGADRLRNVGFQNEKEHQARRILRELGRPPDLDEAEKLRLRADEPVIIRKLGQQFAELRGLSEEAQRTIARHDAQIRRHEKELSDLKAPGDIEQLRRAVSDARKAGDLDARLAEARSKLARAAKLATAALPALPGWNRSDDELVSLAVPLNATVEQYESRFQQAARQREDLSERHAAEDDAIRQLQTQLQSLEFQHDVPTETALLDAREQRDQGWRLVKAAWLDRAPAGPEFTNFVESFASGSTLDAAYEQTVHRSDEVADRLRREADRVARKAEILAQLDQHRSRRADLEQQSDRLDEDRASLDRDWSAMVGPLGVESVTRTPGELRAWIGRREEVLRLLEKRDEACQNVESIEQTLTPHHAAVSRAYAEAVEPSAPSGSKLSDILERAELAIKRCDDLVQKRSKLETKLTAAQTDRDAAQLSLERAETRLSHLLTEWSGKMARIGLDADAAPEQAEVFLTKINDLLKTMDERRGFQSRIHGIDRDADQFARDVAAMAERVAPDLVGHAADEAARELAVRLRDAQAAAQEAASLMQQRQRAEAGLRDAETQRAEARVCLERLCEEAGCTDFNQLPEAERRSQELARLESDLGECEEQLLAIAAGTDRLPFTSEVEKADPDELGPAIDELESRIVDLESDLKRVDQTIGAERQVLAGMDSRDGAAESAEKVQAVVARLQGDIARFATLKVAAAVLHRGIERYRDKNQGPILARASQIFATLTGGSFARLRIDDDGDGRSVLMGVRPDGRLVGVDGMSDGSHDQLYLALRLASLESWLLSHEPIPFVVDDILLNFDDHRATNALRALAELSRRTQVLFFTHHHHIIDLACTHLPHDVVFVHELPRSGSPVTAAIPEDLPTTNRVEAGELPE
ncbi:MAG: AAA family ATPase [Isosphaeraceae bacterium]